MKNLPPVRAGHGDFQRSNEGVRNGSPPAGGGSAWMSPRPSQPSRESWSTSRMPARMGCHLSGDRPLCFCSPSPSARPLPGPPVSQLMTWAYLISGGTQKSEFLEQSRHEGEKSAKHLLLSLPRDLSKQQPPAPPAWASQK